MVVFRLTLRQSVLLHRYIVVAPYISAGMSLLLSPAVQNGAYFSLVIYKAAGGFQAEELMLVEMEAIAVFFNNL